MIRAHGREENAIASYGGRKTAERYEGRRKKKKERERTPAPYITCCFRLLSNNTSVTTTGVTNRFRSKPLI